MNKKDMDKLMKEGIEVPKVIILDNNPLSIAGYAEEFPENWKKICDALDSSKTQKENRK